MSQPSSDPCLSVDALVELMEGRLDGAALARVKEHVAGCRACAGLVDGLDSAEVRAVRPSTAGVEVHWAQGIVAEGTHGRILVTVNLVPAGARIADRFVIVSHAGSGGMGAVYRARDDQTGGTVALKLLQRSGDPDIAERFAREARVLSELSHPGIVAYLAHGETETGAP
jgi:hypothetical protein